MLVSCLDCRYFLPNKTGTKAGIGYCKVYEHYLNKCVSKSELRGLLLKLGNDPDKPVFWGGSSNGNKTRLCEKYAGVI